MKNIEKTEKDKHWIIYKHTNKINGKVYIGQTSCMNPNDRWKDGDGYKKQKTFYKDIKKYGWEGFSHEILEEGITCQEEADRREMYYIVKFHSFIGYVNSTGYNATPGGVHYWKSRRFSEEEEKKLFLIFDSYHPEGIKKAIEKIFPDKPYKLVYNMAHYLGLTSLYKCRLTVMKDMNISWEGTLQNIE